MLGTFTYRSSLRKSWDGDCFDQDLLQDLLLVEFEKVLVVKKIYIVVKFEKVVVVVVVGLIQCIWSKIGWGQSGCEADKGPA